MSRVRFLRLVVPVLEESKAYKVGMEALIVDPRRPVPIAAMVKPLVPTPDLSMDMPTLRPYSYTASLSFLSPFRI